MSQSTLKIFRFLYEHLPPLLPEDISLRMKAELESLAGQGMDAEEKAEMLAAQLEEQNQQIPVSPSRVNFIATLFSTN